MGQKVNSTALRLGVNDRLLSNVDLWFNDNYYSENFKDMIGKPLKEGYIALQSEGHPVKFRNIIIKELD